MIPAVLMQINPQDKCKLSNQNQRHSDDKIPVFCFVAEHIHSGQGPNAPSQQGEQEQGTLPDAPFSVSCPGFVSAHEGKTEDIHYRKINKQQLLQCHKKISFFNMLMPVIIPCFPAKDKENLCYSFSTVI